MSSIDTLSKRLDKLIADTNDSTLQEQWNGILAREYESLLADLDVQIAAGLPQQLNTDSPYPFEHFSDEQLRQVKHELVELQVWLDEHEDEPRQAYFANAKKKRRRARV